MTATAVLSTACLAPGNFGFADFLAGRNAIRRLQIDAPSTLGGPVPDSAETPTKGWRPRSVDLAIRVAARLDIDPEVDYGLVLGMSNLHAEPSYLEYVLQQPCRTLPDDRAARKSVSVGVDRQHP